MLPPPDGSKKAVLKFLSNSSIVIAPAKTGNDNNSKIAVTNIAQTNNGNLCADIPLVLIFITVVMKFIAPNREDIPAKCKLKIARSTLPPEWAKIPAKGGYHLFILYIIF